MSKVNLKKISTDQNNFYNIKGTLDAEKRNLFFEFHSFILLYKNVIFMSTNVLFLFPFQLLCILKIIFTFHLTLFFQI